MTYIHKIIFILVIISLNSYGQDLRIPKSILAPTSANLGTYGDIPMNLFNGNSNISIPLYSFNVKNVPLNISLNYNSSGVKVNDIPSWVGQNWSLDCGGVITRQINGLPDELKVVHSSTGMDLGYFYPESHQRLNSNDWNNFNYLENIAISNQGPFINFTQMNINLRDSEPDIFTFNFMGIVGKFFLGEDGKWKVSSNSNLKIEILESDFFYPLSSDGYVNQTSVKQSKTIGKIIVIDDSGNKYVFGKNSQSNIAIEYSKDFISQKISPWVANSWYLVEVIDSQDSRLYSLEYERSNSFSAFFYKYTRKSDHNIYQSASSGFPSLSCSFSVISSQGYHGERLNNIYGTLNSYVNLKTIKTLYNEIINFNSNFSNSIFYQNSSEIKSYINDELSILSSVNINETSNYFYHLTPYVNETSNVSDYIISKIKFKKLSSISGAFNAEFVYNEPNYTGQHSQRLNLNKVILDGISSKFYQFDYDRFDQLPLISSDRVDHNGYFNDTYYSLTSSSILSPNFQTLYFNSRNTNLDKVKIGALTKITYPTKGYSTFEYEPNFYSGVVNDDKNLIQNFAGVSGGLRIKKIMSFDINGNIKSKDYKYVKNYQSNNNSTEGSGVLNNFPKYFWNNWTSRQTSNNVSLTEYIFSTNPIIPLSNFSGAHITYDEVVEIDENNGYKIYKFSNHNDYYDEISTSSFDLQNSPYSTITDRSLLRGKLKELSIYDKDNNLLQRTQNTYSNNSGNNKYVKGANVHTIACSGSPGWGAVKGGGYKIYYFDNELVESKTISYLSNGNFEEVENYVYEYYPSLIEGDGDNLIIKNCKNSSICEDFKYPHNYLSSINTTLIQKRIIQPLEIIKSINNVILEKRKVNYDNVPIFGTSNFVLAPSLFFKSKGDLPYETNIVIDYYSIYKDVLMYHESDGLYTLFAYGYFGKYIVSEIKGEGFVQNQVLQSFNLGQEINSLVSPTNINLFFNSNINQQIKNKLADFRNNFTNSFTNSFIKTYTYDYGGLNTINDEKNNEMKFEYNAERKLREVRLFNNQNSVYELVKAYFYNYKN